MRISGAQSSAEVGLSMKHRETMGRKSRLCFFRAEMNKLMPKQVKLYSIVLINVLLPA